MNKLNTQSSFVDAIKTGQAYIVGSVDKSGDMSFCTCPTVHTQPDTARQECQRLAKVHPGKMFIFARLAGGELVPTQAISI